MNNIDISKIVEEVCRQLSSVDEMIEVEASANTYTFQRSMQRSCSVLNLRSTENSLSPGNTSIKRGSL